MNERGEKEVLVVERKRRKEAGGVRGKRLARRAREVEKGSELSVTGTTVGRNRGPAVLPLPSNSWAAAFGSESESEYGLLLLGRDLFTILVSRFGDHLLGLRALNL